MKKICFFYLISFFFIKSSIIFAEEDVSQQTTWRFSGIPVVNFDTDKGFGGGLVGTVYQDQDDIRPYKLALGGQIFLTTKGVQSHYLKWDRLRLFDTSLRFSGRTGFFSTISQNYCGKASEASCGTGKQFQNRFMSIFVSNYLQYTLWQKEQVKLNLMGSYRGSYYMTKDFQQDGPYPGSLYERDFGQETTDGWLSLLEMGLIVDARDNEPAPTQGYWVEGSLRGAAPFVGSQWQFWGANVSGRFYLPFDERHKVVFASQTILDFMSGDAPYDVISKVGGTMSQNDYNAFGGQYLGRGIREQMFVGRIKAIEQLELRYTFWSFDLFSQHFDLTGAGLLDFGLVAWDTARIQKDMSRPLVGFGTGLRIAWNKTFIVRGDVAFSPEEHYAPGIYITIGNVF